MTLTLFNSLTRKKEVFTPQDVKNIRMYVCGPTVYDRPHIGNARAVVVYDVLFRLLRQIYGENHVTYARNITDVDDKIIVAAKERGISIQQLTTEVTAQFHEDMSALHCMLPTHEPRATEYIGKMHEMISRLIKNGHAYVADNHVLFDVTSDADYGVLSGRTVEEQQAGARIAIESYKRHPGDFVLWKPADAEDDNSSIFDSPWGKGRPGWHIECSAMSTDLLGETFDLHGGGADLKFPHHENEIAQSCCANPGSEFAKLWLHNGFLTVNGEKMSKSLGNFITVKDLLDRGVQGEVIRYVLLSARYSEPLDWTDKLLSDAKKTLDGWYRKLPQKRQAFDGANLKGFIEALSDDLNFPKAFSVMHTASQEELYTMGHSMGFFNLTIDEWFKGNAGVSEAVGMASGTSTALGAGESVISENSIIARIDARIAAKKARNWAESDRIRDELKAQGIILEDRPDGTTDWRRA